MAGPDLKRASLLRALETFTRKEGLAIESEDLEILKAMQLKKAKALRALQSLEDAESGPHEQARLEETLSRLRAQEAENAALLEAKMKANRSELRKISQSRVCASNLRGAYAGKSRSSSRSSSLDGKA